MGRDSSRVQEQLRNAQHIQATEQAAILESGAVVTSLHRLFPLKLPRLQVVEVGLDQELCGLHLFRETHQLQGLAMAVSPLRPSRWLVFSGYRAGMDRNGKLKGNKRLIGAFTVFKTPNH